ncbi:transglutaminase superfamily protein [Anaerobacterium chartisolvens]|uniref:Transglutaminase superfamily protein n=1 Tax=Anaerobacterium chartisolvens TaxID=1297424 RepID=A0A369B8F0_9FIRM|nr:DUF5050 domain-containing protein [Anaerobacterium chartisolvens]RCX16826.1 transglutaminase superfamily protein [Anaerobacterium chartisolvens]
MKGFIKLSCLLFVFSLAVAFNVSAAYAEDAPAVKQSALVEKEGKKILEFPDKNLEKAVREALEKHEGDISLEQAGTLEALDASGRGISELEGIQYLTGLKDLYLFENKIKDITALSALKDLETVYLQDNMIGDIRPLNGLKKIKTIDLWDAQSLDELKLLDRAAEEIIRKVIKPGMTELEKEIALHDYIVCNTDYDKENYYSSTIPKESHDPYGILIKKVGVCDGYAETMNILLSKCGIESIVVIGEGIGDLGWEGHAWNIVKIDGVYYHLDVTYNDPTTEDGSSYMQHKYFNISDTQMGVDHNWDRKKYPACKEDNPIYWIELDENRNAAVGRDVYVTIENESLYRKNLSDGSNAVKLCEDKVSDVSLDGIWIYYRNLSDGNKVYKITLGGTMRTRLNNESSSFVKVYDNMIFYLNDQNRICRMDTNGNSKTFMNSDALTGYFTIKDGWIYYRCFNWGSGAALYRVKPDGTIRLPVIADSLEGFKMTENGYKVSYFLGRFEYIIDDWVYYVNESDGGKIYKIKVAGDGKTKLNDHRSSRIELQSGFIYYKNEYGKYCRMKMDGSTPPEVLED